LSVYIGHSIICILANRIIDKNLIVVNRFFIVFLVFVKGVTEMNYEKLQNYCKTHNLSISEFERRCKIGNGTIGKWIHGKAEPTFKTLFKMEAFTGIPVSDWLGGKES